MPSCTRLHLADILRRRVLSRRRALAILAVCAFAPPFPNPLHAEDNAMTKPRVFVLDPDLMTTLRAQARAGNAALAPAVEKLRQDADKAMGRGPYSVMQKEVAPASGDRHDYCSLGPYWWPDPNKPDGKPYIRKDGKVNPERNKLGDSDRFGDMRGDVLTLALAWWYTGHEPYAEKAAGLLRTWYLDPATRMNPNMNFAQAIPGICDGRGIGIVDAGSQVFTIDAMGLLQDSQAWTEEDRAAMQQWFGEFLDWLLTSKHGKDEDRTSNNHATQYDAQVASYALFTGRDDVARKVLEAVVPRRIDTQIEPDGSQPKELARTKSWGYSCANTGNLVRLALLAEKLDIDLWNARSSRDRTLRSAIDYLLPYAAGEKEWTREQLGGFKPDGLYVVLHLAADRYGDTRYRAVADALKGADRESRDNLLYGPAR